MNFLLLKLSLKFAKLYRSRHGFCLTWDVLWRLYFRLLVPENMKWGTSSVLLFLKVPEPLLLTTNRFVLLTLPNWVSRINVRRLKMTVIGVQNILISINWNRLINRSHYHFFLLAPLKIQMCFLFLIITPLNYPLFFGVEYGIVWAARLIECSGYVIGNHLPMVIRFHQTWPWINLYMKILRT